MFSVNVLKVWALQIKMEDGHFAIACVRDI